MVGLLSKNEEHLILESENFDGFSLSTPKVKYDFSLQKKEQMKQQSGKHEAFWLQNLVKPIH